ncbi:MAG TPA: hypothetical protein ENN40_02585 [Candidatus Aminicenantes bacterium]|nr:hypothetical protein [Candidatus Aminicenantes bacterium]
MIFRIGMIGLMLLCGGADKPAPRWGKMLLTDLSCCGLFFATSELPDSGGNIVAGRSRYGPANLLDGDFTTTWVEGRPDEGIGESVFVVVPDNCRTLSVFPGHGRSRELFLKNNRPARLEVTFLAGIHCEGEVAETGLMFHTRRFARGFPLELKDEFRRQTFPVPVTSTELAEFLARARREFSQGFDRPVKQVVLIAQLEIRGVYRGTRWNDTCISEVFAHDRFVPNGDLLFPRVSRVYVDDTRPGAILLNTPDKSAVEALKQADVVFQLGEVSANGYWAVIMQLSAAAPPGRVETRWRLLDVRRACFVEDDLARTWGSEVFGPFFLGPDSGFLYLEHACGRVRLY